MAAVALEETSGPIAAENAAADAGVVNVVAAALAASCPNAWLAETVDTSIREKLEANSGFHAEACSAGVGSDVGECLSGRTVAPESSAPADCCACPASTAPVLGLVSGDKKICVEVKAEDVDGTHVVTFKLEPTAAFRRLMQAWCKHNDISLDAAQFMLNGQELRPNGSLDECGWTPSLGAPVIQVIPRETCPDDMVGASPVSVSGRSGGLTAQGGTSTPVALEVAANLPSVTGTASTATAIMDQVSRSVSTSKNSAPSDPDGGIASVADSSRDRMTKLVIDPCAPTIELSAESINVKVVATSIDGPNSVEFSMKPRSPFDKLMRAWCNHADLPLEETQFIFDGRRLEPTDCPSQCGWTSSRGALVIQALAVEARPGYAVNDATALGHDVDGSTPASDAACVSVNCGTAGKDFSSDARNVPITDASALNVASNDEKMHVQIIAEGLAGTNVVNIMMRPTTTFGNMMQAWCNQNEVPLEEAQFLLNGRKLLPNESPQKLGWTLARGVLIVEAVPCEAGATDAASVANSNAARSSERLSVSPGEHRGPGNNTRSAQSNVDHGFGVSPAKVSKSDDGKVTGNDGHASENVNNVEKMKVRVVAESVDGQSSVDFSMRPGSTFERMMRAWCDHNDVALEAAVFVVNGRRLKPSDSPVECGWTQTCGVLVIQALPRDGGLADGAGDATASESKHPAESGASTDTPRAVQTADPSIHSPVLVNTASDEKITVQVVAESAAGPNTVDFRMKPNTAFTKMMQAWCKINGVALEAAQFVFDGQTLNPDDSPEKCGWSPTRGVLVIQAVPRHGGANDGASNDAASASEGIAEPRTRLSAGAAASVNASGCDKEVGPVIHTPVVGSEPSEEKISVQVVAASADGPNIVDFKMKPGTMFGKMMEAWCSHNEVPMEAARFLLDGRRLRCDDSPNTCQWTPALGTLTIQAVPCDHAQDAEADKASALTLPRSGVAKVVKKAGDAVAACKDQRPAQGSRIVEVRVEAQGQCGLNVTTVTMRGKTRFEKVMVAWCQQNSISRQAVRFMFDGHELVSDSTPNSCGWSASMGIPTILVVPRQTQAAAGVSGIKSEFDSAVRPADSSCEPRSDLRTSSQNDPSSQQGAPTLAKVKKRTSTPLDPDDPATQGVAESLPKKSKLSRTSGLSVHSANELPRKSLAPSLSSDNIGSSASATGSFNTSATCITADDEKVSIRVNAESDDGIQTLTFKMKAGSPFEKVMSAWSAHHGIAPDEARFSHNGHELHPHDTPRKIGWRPSENGDLVVYAVPRKAEAPQTSKPDNVEATDKADPATPAPGMNGNQRLGEGGGRATPAAAVGVAVAGDAPAGMVNVRVVAQGEDGTNILPFRIKLRTPFGKVIARWCEYHGIPQEQASFLYCDKEVCQEDTPQSVGWVDTGSEQELTIHAAPRSIDPVPRRRGRRGGGRGAGRGAAA